VLTTERGTADHAILTRLRIVRSPDEPRAPTH
jgi:hypothetical protein